MKSLVILISGRGSNMPAVVRPGGRRLAGARRRGAEQPARRPRPGVAAGLGLPTRVIDHRGFTDRAAFDAALADAIDAHAPDLVLLAGFMRVLTPAFVRRYDGRLLNIHPSLLPAFTGLHTHRRAIEAGCKLAGATVHFVSPEVDGGPIVAQAAVSVLPDDSEATLAARVLEREHLLYPRAVRWALDGLLRIEGSRVTQTRGEPQLLLPP